jgi:oligopeptidase A
MITIRGPRKSLFHRNVLLKKSKRNNLPLYDAIKASDIVPCANEILDMAMERFKEIEKLSKLNPSFQNFVMPLLAIDKMMSEDLWSPVNHLSHVNNSDEIRESIGKIIERITQVSVEIEQSEEIFNGLTLITSSPEWDSLDPVVKRIVEKKILSAKLSGVNLNPDEKIRFREIQQRLTTLSKLYGDNVMDTIKNYEMILTQKEQIVGLPESYLSLASNSYKSKYPNSTSSNSEGPWRITFDSPSLIPFLEYSERRDLRKIIYLDYIKSAGAENTEIVYEILALRKEKSILLGYDNYCSVSLATKMVESRDQVMNLLTTLREKSFIPATQEQDELNTFAQSKKFEGSLQHWDISIWSRKLKESKYQYQEEELKKYFQMPNVIAGLFNLVQKLFSVKIVECNVEEYSEIPRWHQDVRFYYLYDENSQSSTPIAGLYMDPYVRPETKRGGAWMDQAVSKSDQNGVTTIPVAHIVCNGTPPLSGKPSLMTFRDVETLFHELGHALQHMLATSNYVEGGISGVEWDAVELPSQFMENWCYHYETLKGITEHVETGEKLPDSLWNKVRDSKNYRSASQMLRQLLFAIVDLELHSSYNPLEKEKFSIFDLQKAITEKTSTLPMLPEDKFLCKFNHIFSGGYSAGYYSYKWAEVMSADCFGAFEEAGLDNDMYVKELGKKFRDTVLGQAGSIHASQVFKNFRDRDPDPTALLRHNNLLKQ